MEFINEYGLLILIILTVIAAAMTGLIVRNTFKLNKRLLSNKITFKALLESSIETGQNKLSIIAINQSLLDVSITSLGIVHGTKYFDFIQNYTLQENISGERVVIPQRASIKMELSTGTIEDTIINNSEDNNYKKTRVYAIDKAGNLSCAKAKSIRYVLIKKWKQIMLDKKLLEKKEKAELRLKNKNEFLESYSQKAANKEKIALKDRLKAFIYKQFCK